MATSCEKPQVNERRIFNDPASSSTKTGESESESKSESKSGSGDSMAHDSKSAYGVYEKAAVASDSKTCSDIGRSILETHGGNAIDAAVATALASTVIYPHSTSISGGFYATIYHRDHGWCAIDARETAPMGIKPEMFSNPDDHGKTFKGGLSICVPGFIKGLLMMQIRFGSLSWPTVVEPSLKLLRNGFPIENQTYYALVRDVATSVVNFKGFEMYLDERGHVKPPGSIIKHPALARTFQTIRDYPTSFYNGSLARDMVQEIQDAGGIVTLQDFQSYEVTVKPTLKTDLPGGFTLHSGPPSAGGACLNHILSIMTGYNLTPQSIATPEGRILTEHRFLEAARFAMARKMELGDEMFVDAKKLVENMTSRSYGELTRKKINDQMTLDLDAYGAKTYNSHESGTSHSSVLDPQGNAVSITGSMNYYFGSLVVGKKTGIHYNNEMYAFSHLYQQHYIYNTVGDDAANLVAPGKRPMSSMCPAIVWNSDRQRVCLVTGAAGSRVTTQGVARSIIDILYFHQSVPQALDHPQVFQDLIPPVLMAQDDVPQFIKKGLQSKGHHFLRPNTFTVTQMIHVSETGEVIAGCDHRKGGEPSGF